MTNDESSSPFVIGCLGGRLGKEGAAISARIQFKPHSACDDCGSNKRSKDASDELRHPNSMEFG